MRSSAEKLTTGKISASRVTKSASSKLKEAVVIGIDKKGEFYAASSTGDVDRVLSLMEGLRRRLLDGTYA